jgi:predicted PurR-regulated permease PerM
MFIALLFLPLMRWLGKRKVPNWISISLIILIIAGFLKIVGQLIKLSSREMLGADNAFFDKAREKLGDLLFSIEDFFGVEYVQGENFLVHFLQRDQVVNNFGYVFNFISDSITITLMTVFFVVLWLAESINFEKVLNTTIFKKKHASVKVFRKIEKDLVNFIKVKFIVSLFTGIGIGLACFFFDVSFPIFWGLFAFVINFVQMVGSVVTVILLSLFAFVELDPTSILFFFILTITAVQVLFGGILEPIFMGKSFSINVITILVMLMLWGYIWGVPGLIMAIPLTVFIKIVLEQFPDNKMIVTIITGSDNRRKRS